MTQLNMLADRITIDESRVNIKTKGGVVGKPIVSVDYYEGFNRFTKTPKLADGISFMEGMNEAAMNSGRGTNYVYSQDYIDNTRSGVDPLLYPNVNWRKEVFNDWAHSRRVNANVRGGSAMAQFYASVSYYNETGMVATNDYENYDSQINFDRYNFTTNLNIEVTPTTKVTIGAQGYYGIGRYTGETAETIFSSTMEVNPVMYPKMFVIDGVEHVPGTHTQGAERNPYADATKRGYRETLRNRMQSNIRLSQDLKMLTPGLSFAAMFAFDVENNRDRDYKKRESTYYFKDRSEPYDENGVPNLISTWDHGSTVLGYDRRFTGETKDYFETALNYDRLFGEDHRIGGMFIYTQQNKTNNDAGSLIDAIAFRMQGIAARATYSWRDRYFGEFNIGYNGGENFPKNRRFGVFPAFGVGWVASNEPFWGSLNEVFPFFKIRYTNGKVGNSNVEGRRFMYLEQYSGNDDYSYSFGTHGRQGFGVKNPMTSLGWEVSHKQDLGFDIHMLKGDLNLTFDLFKENRTEILLKRDKSLPGYAGFQEVPYGNVGESKTYGFDANVDYYKRFNKDWGVTIRGNITWADPEWVYDDSPIRDDAWRNRQGYSLTSIEGLTAIGLYSQSDIDRIQAWHSLPDAEKQDSQPFPTPPAGGINQIQAGDVMYADRNGDGIINDADKSWLGNGDVPEINYGFGFNLDYKAFTLGILFQGTAKADRFVDGIVYPYNGAGNENVYSNIGDRWQADSPTDKVFYPRINYKNDAVGSQNNFRHSTWWLKDMSFLRLKTLQISYNIPEAWCHKAHLKNASVYAMGMNLFYLSKWKLWDPELNTGNGGKYPNTASISVGVSLSF